MFYLESSSTDNINTHSRPPTENKNAKKHDLPNDVVRICKNSVGTLFITHSIASEIAAASPQFLE